MTDEFLRSGDQAIYNPSFGPALVTVSPGVLAGSGQMCSVSKALLCVKGDEASATVPGCPYISGGYTIPGAGTLSIAALGSDQLSRKTRSGGKPVILRGTTFTARFQVMVPAQMPTSGGPVPDPLSQYSGTGSFQTTNTTVRDKG